MTSVWLGHKTWTIFMSEPLQTCRGCTNTPSSPLWICRSGNCTWKYLPKDLLPHANVMAVPAPLQLPSNSHPLHATKTTDKTSLNPSPPALPPLTALQPPCRENSRNWRLLYWLFFRMNITSQKSWPISSRCSQESIWPKMFHNEMNCCVAVITEWKFTIPVIHLVHNVTKALFENVKCSGGAKYYRYANSSSFCVRLYVSSL